MNNPSSAASHKYSGQCLRNARVISVDFVVPIPIRKRRQAAALQSAAREMFCVSFGSATSLRVAFESFAGHGRTPSMLSFIRSEYCFTIHALFVGTDSDSLQLS